MQEIKGRKSNCYIRILTFRTEKIVAFVTYFNHTTKQKRGK